MSIEAPQKHRDRPLDKPLKKSAKKTAKKALKKESRKPGRKRRENVAETHIDFNARAELRKWPSLKNERVPEPWGGVPYLIFEGTLGDCIREFMSRPAQHLYEIHTKPQLPLVTEVLQPPPIAELARLREFL
jgi:hypothetical protein